MSKILIEIDLEDPKFDKVRSLISDNSNVIHELFIVSEIGWENFNILGVTTSKDDANALLSLAQDSGLCDKHCNPYIEPYKPNEIIEHRE